MHLGEPLAVTAEPEAPVVIWCVHICGLGGAAFATFANLRLRIYDAVHSVVHQILIVIAVFVASWSSVATLEGAGVGEQVFGCARCRSHGQS